MTPADLQVARALADKLMTTCEPNRFWDELDALTRDQYAVLDTIAFECSTCNHWFSIADQHERHSRFYCKDCL
jgi:hypothetical protein